MVILKPDTRIAEQAEKENKRVNWVVAAKKDGPEYADLLREFWPEVESLLRNGDIIVGGLSTNQLLDHERR